MRKIPNLTLVGQIRVTLYSLIRYADSITLVTLFEFIFFLVFCFCDCRLSSTTEIKPAVSFASQLTLTFVIYFLKEFILIHCLYVCFFFGIAGSSEPVCF